ncbi:MAG: hypothetical protein PHN80_01630 [Hespellia sp.]|nr:hypothetical protein [Hespellia sp.]
MNSNPSKRSSLFLLELMIAILFFCLCSAICVRLFVQSHVISSDTQNLNMAMNHTTNLAEIFRGVDNYRDALKEQFPNGILSEDRNTFTLYYDSDWKECSMEDVEYAVSISVTERGDGITDADFHAISLDSKDSIYQFETSKYVKEGTEHE